MRHGTNLSAVPLYTRKRGIFVPTLGARQTIISEVQVISRLPAGQTDPHTERQSHTLVKLWGDESKTGRVVPVAEMGTDVGQCDWIRGFCSNPKPFDYKSREISEGVTGAVPGVRDPVSDRRRSGVTETADRGGGDETNPHRS
ncbi:hypothetical protein RRG08_020437 [Elysia crispata]|uniref:Uncharacterized protein n=1 Tax=Elysia crispata TaxID=231223 RepID=A0AAE1B512_9GAST|nr:hypothetical protein RRG08_020437 [Elysia crispata]